MSVKKTENTEYFTKNFKVAVYKDRIHGIIFRLKTIVSVFFIKCLNSGRIFHKSDNHIAVLCSGLLFDKHLIPIENTGIDHTVAFNLQHETLCIWHHFRRYREICLYILYCQDRLACSDSANQRHINNLAAHKIKLIVDDLNRSGFRRVSADIAVLLKRLQMGVNGRR